MPVSSRPPAQRASAATLAQPSAAQQAPMPRLAALDLARGFAVLAMIAYHFTWDLGYFHWVSGSPAMSPAGRLIAHAIADGFLALAGISISLAAMRPDFSRQFWRRQARIGAAAAAISLATAFAMPQSWIFFGILDCIFACSLIAYALRPLSTIALVLLSLGALALPLVIADPIFDSPALVWLGLGVTPPMTNDFAPLLPHLCALLAGMIFARLRLHNAALALTLAFANDNRPSRPPALWRRALSVCGRHSLALYLLHQPLLFAGFLGLNTLLTTPESVFEADCQQQCQVAGGDAPLCRAACACVTQDMKAANLWTSLQNNTLDEEGRLRMGDIALQCEKRAAIQP